MHRPWIAVGIAAFVLASAVLLMAWLARLGPRSEILPPGSDDSAAESARIEAASSAPLLVEESAAQAPECVLVGRAVVTGGEPIPGALATLGEHAARTGPDGRFEIHLLPGGRAGRLVLEANDFAPRAFDVRDRASRGKDRIDAGDVPLARACQLDLRVIDPERRPVEGVELRLLERGAAREWELERLGLHPAAWPARDLGAGQYRLERAAPGRHRLEVRAPGFASLAGDELWIDVPRRDPFTVRLERPGRLAGIVCDTAGEPLAGARLRVLGTERRQEYDDVRADAAGQFDLTELVPDTYTLWARAAGHVEARVGPFSTDASSLRIVLERAATFTATVVADDDGSPVEGVEIEAYRILGDLKEEYALRATTGANGFLSLTGLAPGDYGLRVSRRGFLRQDRWYEFSARGGEQLATGELRLPRGLRIAGSVEDAATHAPLGGAEVLLHHVSSLVKEGSWSGRDQVSSVTGPDGRFQLLGLAEGEHHVAVSLPGHVTLLLPETITVEPGPAPIFAWALERGASISGIVLDPAGKACRGATVSVAAESLKDRFGMLRRRPPPVVTGADGRFVIAGLLPADDHIVSARLAGFAAARSDPVHLGPTDAVSDREVHLGPTDESTLRGTVTSPHGETLRGCTVLASPRGEWGWRKTSVDGAGAYELAGLAPGAWQVWVERSRRTLAERSGIILAANATTTLDLQVEPQRGIAGRVVDRAQLPIQGAEVAARGEKTTTVQDGSFFLFVSGGDAEVVEVEVTKVGFEASRTAHSPGAAAEIVLDRSAVLAGHLRLRGQDQVRKAKVITRSTDLWRPLQREVTRLDGSGAFELFVPEGQYVLEATAADASPAFSQPETVRAGERREGIAIELEPGGAIAGRVVRRGSGEPIEDASIFLDLPDPYRRSYSGLDNVKTDRRGRFELTGLPAAVLGVRVHHGDGRGKRLEGLRVEPGERKEIEVEVGAAGRIRGLVTRRGEPVAAARIVYELRSPEGEADGALAGGPDGRFEILDLPAGECRLWANHAGAVGKGSSAVVVRVSEETASDVELRLDASVLVHLQWTVAGQRWDGRWLELRSLRGDWSSQATSRGEEGAFAVLVPGPGKYSVAAHGSLHRPVLAVPPHVQELEWSFDAPAASLEGTVLDARTGSPIQGAVVSLASREGITSESLLLAARGHGGSHVRTDEAGEFGLPGVGAGEHAVRVTAQGYAEQIVDGILVEERVSTTGLRIALHSGLTYRAQVVDSAGHVVKGALVMVRDERGRPISGPAFFCRAWQGAVNLTEIGPGPYRLEVLHPGFAPLQTTILGTASAGIATLTLSRGGHLRLRLLDARGEPVRGAEVSLAGEGGEDVTWQILGRQWDRAAVLESSSDGAVPIEHLVPGGYRIRATAAGAGAAEASVEVTDGITTEARLELR